MKHENTGGTCLVAHSESAGQCIKCTCGEWITPVNWHTHIARNEEEDEA